MALMFKRPVFKSIEPGQDKTSNGVLDGLEDFRVFHINPGRAGADGIMGSGG